MQSNYFTRGCAASVTTAAMSDQHTGRQGDRDLFNRIPARLHRQPGAHTAYWLNYWKQLAKLSTLHLHFKDSDLRVASFSEQLQEKIWLSSEGMRGWQVTAHIYLETKNKIYHISNQIDFIYQAPSLRGLKLWTATLPNYLKFIKDSVAKFISSKVS